MNIRMISKLLVITLGATALIGCGKANNEPLVGPASGADWRITAHYDQVTLHHDEDLNVMVGMNIDEVDFYYDKDVQELYQQILLPYETSDTDKTFGSLKAEDLNGDGYTDCTVDLVDANGTVETAVFLWNADLKSFDYIQPEA